jgi:hypothetical protein
MKRILSILLSVILFFTLSFIIYLFTFKLLFKTNYFDRIIKENNVSEYINLSLGQKSTFVNNINTSYQDLKKLGLSEKEITNIINDTNISQVLNNIIINRMHHVLYNEKTINYTLDDLDNILTKNINNSQVKEYILQNDYKIISFETSLDYDISNINYKYLTLIVVLLTLILVIIILFIINNNLFLNYFFTTTLVVGLNNIIICLITPYSLNIILENKLIKYVFSNLYTNYFKEVLIIDLILVLISTIILSVNDKVNSKNNRKIKPRVRKRVEYDENYNF